MKGSVTGLDIEKKIFNVTRATFEALALQVFHFQYDNNDLYRQFCNAVNKKPRDVTRLAAIPFLPISFFKSHEVKTTGFNAELIFESSGTSGQIPSRHFLKDPLLYTDSFMHTFTIFYGNPEKYCILGLLPSYLERGNSSLVWMTDALLKKSRCSDSGFYLDDFEKLREAILKNEQNGQQTILIGVTYALLDFFEKFSFNLNHTIIMETGGMKGRKKEITREAVHRRIIQRTGVDAVHSEYGMTELLSQAYAKKHGRFRCPQWMKIFTREEDDPLSINTSATSEFTAGAINIIDLANLYSCSFIATDDVGKVFKDESFEILGRLDISDLRGCSLMVV